MSNILSAEDVGRVLSMLDASDLCATFGLSEKTQQKVLDSVPALCASHEALRNTLLDFTTYNTELMKRAAAQARRIEALRAGLRTAEPYCQQSVRQHIRALLAPEPKPQEGAGS